MWWQPHNQAFVAVLFLGGLLVVANFASVHVNAGGSIGR